MQPLRSPISVALALIISISVSPVRSSDIQSASQSSETPLGNKDENPAAESASMFLAIPKASSHAVPSSDLIHSPPLEKIVQTGINLANYPIIPFLGNATNTAISPDAISKFLSIHNLIGTCLSLEKILSSIDENSDDEYLDSSSLQQQILREMKTKMQLQVLLDSYCSRREQSSIYGQKRLEYHASDYHGSSLILNQRFRPNEIALIVFNIAILLLTLLCFVIYFLLKVKASAKPPLLDIPLQENRHAWNERPKSRPYSASTFTVDLKKDIYENITSLSGSFLSYQDRNVILNEAYQLTAQRPVSGLPNSFYFTHFIHKRIIGKGGCGAVFLAEHRTTGINYAVKIVAISSLMSARIRLEASMHASLDHINVVRYFSSWEDQLSDQELRKLRLIRVQRTHRQSSGEVFDSDSDERASSAIDDYHSGSSDETMCMNFLFIQMCYYEHGTLRDWLSRTNRNVDIAENLTIFKQLTDGLLYLHSQGILHRDLKPGNIFISYAQTTNPQQEDRENSNQRDIPALCVKIGDFGLSIVKNNKCHVSQSDRGHLKNFSDRTAGVGTPAYCSPEQLSSGRVSESSDVFALGIIMLECFIDVPTECEKYVIFESARRGSISSSKHEVARQHENILNLIMDMISYDPVERISLMDVKDRVHGLISGYQAC